MTEPSQATDLLARETIDSMRDAVLSIDRQGTIIMINPAAEQLLKTDAEVAIGQNFAHTFVDREELERFNDCILDAIYDPSTAHTAEIRIEVQEGSTRHLVVRTNLLSGQDGQPIGVVAVIADVSEQVRLLERQLENARVQQQFGQFFIYTLGLMSIGAIVSYLIAGSIVDVNIYTEAFSWQYLLVLLIPSLFAIRIMGLRTADLGLSTTGLRQSLKEGILGSLGILAVTAALSGILSYLGRLPGEPMQVDFLGTSIYFLHSLLQEMVARGFLLTSFQRFLNDRKGLRSVLLTSATFGLFHLHFGLGAVMLTIASGIAFGWFYLRTRNIAGVTLIHFMAGVSAFAFGLF